MNIISRFMKMPRNVLRRQLRVIIFGTDTKLGKGFDVVLIFTILLSVLITIFDTILDTIPWAKTTCQVLEGVFTVFFTLEYILRIYCTDKPSNYIFSFFGIVDLLATIPPYMALFVSQARFMVIIRMFRLIRVFRVFKLFNFLSEGNLLLRSLIQSSKKILVFFLFVLILIVTIGTLMYMVESHVPGTKFTSIPRSIYWAAVTTTTVGYGDMTPTTAFGQFFATMVMILGYTIIAIPTGIVSYEMIIGSRRIIRKDDNIQCPRCHRKGHDADANYCKYCGHDLFDKTVV